MPVKMRLARHGRKRYAYYHIVVADSRAPRDGRYIERIGTYNPNTNPATTNLDFDKAYDWLVKGAQPTDTVKTILSNKGVLYKKHLMGGVKKGAFNEDEAEKKLEKWLTEKEAQIQAKIDQLAGEESAAMKKQFDAESKLRAAKEAAIAAKNTELAAEAAAARKEKTEETKNASEETADEKIVAEVTVEETPATEKIQDKRQETETASEETVTEETAAEETTVEETVAEKTAAEETTVEETVEVPAEKSPAIEEKPATEDAPPAEEKPTENEDAPKEKGADS